MTRPSATGARLRYAAAGLAFAAEFIHLWAFAHEFVVFPTRGPPLLPAAAGPGGGPGSAGAGLAFAAGFIPLWAFAHEFVVFPTRGLPLLPVAAVQGMLAV